MKSLVLVGDRSSHGNIVTNGSSRVVYNGRQVATVGSPVTGDPHRHGPNSIVSPGSSRDISIGGRRVAFTSASTGCGGSMNGSGARVVG